jgi:uncharacterized protein (DUF2336 family)
MHFPALLEELDRAVAAGTPERTGDILLRIADLFASKAKTYSDGQVGVFDDVFVRLAAHIESSARTNLAKRLADEPCAPAEISRLLASDDEISVAAPVLERSRALDTATLAAIASTKSQRHLLAMSKREQLDEAVTDVLVERGDAAVVLSTVHNKGARFSQHGFGRLVDRSHGDDDLAASVGLRPDLPREQLMRLLVRASHEVRSRLQTANPALAGPIQEAVDGAASAVLDEVTVLARDYASALQDMRVAHAAGQLQDSEVLQLAAANDFEKTVAALALLCGLAPEAVERALCHARTDGVLVLAKAAGLSWPTAKAILRLRRAGRDMSPGEYERCEAGFAGLKAHIARQAIAVQMKNLAAQGRFSRPAA